MSRQDVVVYEGLVEENPYGNWSDVDHGVYVGGDFIFPFDHCRHFLDNFVGRCVRITIEEIEPDV